MAKTQMTEIDSWDEVPDFASDDEERDFWDTHSLGPALLDTFEPAEFNLVAEKSERNRKLPLKVDSRLARRLAAEARRQGIDVDELATQILSEALKSRT